MLEIKITVDLADDVKTLLYSLIHAVTDATAKPATPPVINDDEPALKIIESFQEAPLKASAEQAVQALETAITLEQLKPLAINYAKDNGKEALQALLQGYSATKLSDLSPKQLEALHAQISA